MEEKKPTQNEQSPSESKAISEEDNSDLRPELQPIAARHGRKKLEFCVRLAALNVLMDKQVAMSQRFLALGPLTQAVLTAQSELFEIMVTQCGWTMDQVIECLQDIGRAAKLAKPVAETRH